MSPHKMNRTQNLTNSTALPLVDPGTFIRIYLYRTRKCSLVRTYFWMVELGFAHPHLSQTRAIRVTPPRLSPLSLSWNRAAACVAGHTENCDLFCISSSLFHVCFLGDQVEA